MADPSKMSSEEIFFQFCQVKPKNTLEFLSDYILYLLNLALPFDDEKYQKLQPYLLDFMAAGDTLFDFYLKFYSQGKLTNYSKESYISAIRNELGVTDETVIEFTYSFFIGNLNNIQFLRNKKNGKFFEDEVKNYKINLQMNLCHSSISNTEPDFNVLLKLKKNNNQKENKNNENIFEINDKDLDTLINKLKDIYSDIKS